MAEARDVKKKDVKALHKVKQTSVKPMEEARDVLTALIGLILDVVTLNTMVTVLHVSKIYFLKMKGHSK